MIYPSNWLRTNAMPRPQQAKDRLTRTSPTRPATTRPPTTVRPLPPLLSPLPNHLPHTHPATSSGGYGSADTFAPHSQRHADPSPTSSDTGLIDQSLDGGPVGRELQDAKQGADPRAREAFAHEARRDFAPGSQGQYGESAESRGEAGEKLAAGYADQRGRQYEDGGAAGGEGNQGA